MSEAGWTVKRLTGTLGAEVSGLELAKPLGAAQRAALNESTLR